MSGTTTPHVASVNVAAAQDVPWGTLRRSAIDKRPVGGPVRVGPLGLEGDEQADRRHHGGVVKAVYAFAGEDLDDWADELGRPLTPGTFGENLTTRGVDVTQARIGERWRIGTAVLEVASVRMPCSVFAGFTGEPQWVRRFTQRGRPGAYLRVVETGEPRAGDDVQVVEQRHHDVTVGLMFRAVTGERHLLPRLLEEERADPEGHANARRYLASRP
ncbi:MOSC domain-containing protein [Solicola sp. PLA-1-18]|uniref:MOSC domain-containing protein n=1 Tax=Solicola sp. PLA-1-18 TaxID=3380532 RepID=UPI003B79CB0F